MSLSLARSWIIFFNVQKFHVNMQKVICKLCNLSNSNYYYVKYDPTSFMKNMLINTCQNLIKTFSEKAVVVLLAISYYCIQLLEISTQTQSQILKYTLNRICYFKHSVNKRVVFWLHEIISS